MSEALSCPSCALDARPDDVDMDRGIVRCRACDRVYRVATRRRKARAERPARWTETSDGAGALLLQKRWLGWEFLFFVVWGAIWWIGLSEALENGGGVMVLPHALVGMGVAWYTLCVLVNTTTIRAGRGLIKVSHAPLWWPGGVELAARDITQLYVEERQYKRQTSYRLHAVDRGGVGHRVGPTLGTLAEGRWLEERLEEHLAIEDRRHPGEA